MLSHLRNGWQVDQAILSEEDRVVVIRFGHDCKYLFKFKIKLLIILVTIAFSLFKIINF